MSQYSFLGIDCLKGNLTVVKVGTRWITVPRAAR
jgi:hypothetical protein